MERESTADSVGTTVDAVRRLDEAMDRRDLEGVMAALVDDCVRIIDGPSGRLRATGQAAVRVTVNQLLAAVGRFNAAEMRVVPGRVVVRWSHHGHGPAESGTDVISIRGGRVAEIRTILVAGSVLLEALDQ